MPIPNIQRLIISAPFGNWWQPAGATPTLGTFTAEPRPGRYWAALTRWRYWKRLGGSINWLGLRNPGIHWLEEQVDAGRISASDKIVSIHGFSRDDWGELFAACSRIAPAAVEINWSCPNVGGHDDADYYWLMHRAYQFSEAKHTPVIVKLAAANHGRFVKEALQHQITNFHCFNTIKVPGGGLAGAALRQVYPEIITYLKREPYVTPYTLIGGGGVRCVDDMCVYRDAGVEHVAVGSASRHRKFRKAFPRLVQWAHRNWPLENNDATSKETGLREGVQGTVGAAAPAHGPATDGA